MTEPSRRVAEAAAELYGLPPDRFTARRAELVKESKQAGDAEAARRIRAFAKPTRSAAVLNALARSHPARIDELTEVGDALRRAQEALDGDRMRELSGRRRAVIDEAARAAYREAGSPEPSGAVRDEVAATLSAALIEPDVLQALRSGTLVRSAEASGFGTGPTTTLAAVPDLNVDTSTPRRPTKERGSTPRKSAAAKESAGERRERMRAEKQRRDEQRREQRRQDIEAAEQGKQEAEQAESTQREAVRILAEQLADARRVLGERELDTRRAVRTLQKATNAR